MYLETVFIVAMLGVWIGSIIHMYNAGKKQGFRNGNVVGVSNTLKMMEAAGVLDEESYKDVFSFIESGKR